MGNIYYNPLMGNDIFEDICANLHFNGFSLSNFKRNETHRTVPTVPTVPYPHCTHRTVPTVPYPPYPPYRTHCTHRTVPPYPTYRTLHRTIIFEDRTPHRALLLKFDNLLLTFVIRGHPSNLRLRPCP